MTCRGDQSVNISWFLGFGWLTIVALCCQRCRHQPVGGLATLGVVCAVFAAWPAHVDPLSLLQHPALASPACQSHAELWPAGRFRNMPPPRRRVANLISITPCRALAEQVFGQAKATQFASPAGHWAQALLQQPGGLLSASLCRRCRPGAARHRSERIRRDIEASQLGPDILVAKHIELEQGGLEAARYLQALLLGRVR